MQQVLTTIKALADGNRLRVFMALLSQDELCVCQITAMLKLAPATVSRHMSILHTAGLVESRKSGRWVYYRHSPEISEPLLQWLKGSMISSAAIAADRETLQRILSCSPDDLCKAQKTATVKGSCCHDYS